MSVLDDLIAKWPPPALTQAARPPRRSKENRQSRPSPARTSAWCWGLVLALAPAIARAQHAPCVDSRTGLRLECPLPYGEFDLTPPRDTDVDPQRLHAPYGSDRQRQQERLEEQRQWRT